MKSIGPETLHDEFLHVIPTLTAMWEWKGKTYSERRQKIFDLVIHAHEKLSKAKVIESNQTDLKILITLLGAYVDVNTSRLDEWENLGNSIMPIRMRGEDPFSILVMKNLDNKLWNASFQKKYPNVPLDKSRLCKLWENIT